MEKLSKYPAQTYWRSNSPTHFGGATGTFTAVEEVISFSTLKPWWGRSQGMIGNTHPFCGRYADTCCRACSNLAAFCQCSGYPTSKALCLRLFQPHTKLRVLGCSPCAPHAQLFTIASHHSRPHLSGTDL
jgi:hypothetical protein